MYIISYATESHQHLQQRLLKSCNATGLKTFEYNDIFLKSTSFYKNHKDILDQKRGAGYWLWKPFLILHTMGLIDENEIILYLDSHHTIKNVEVIKFIEGNIPQNIFSTINPGTTNKLWTKRDCFILMECDNKNFWDENQTEAGQIAFRKNTFTIEFLKNWLNYAIDPRIITDIANTQGKPNFDSFIDHRHDQSILTNLLIKYKINRINLLDLMNYINA